MMSLKRISDPFACQSEYQVNLAFLVCGCPWYRHISSASCAIVPGNQ